MKNIVEIADKMVNEFKKHSPNPVTHYDMKLREYFQGVNDDIIDRTPEIFIACEILENNCWHPDQHRLFPNNSTWNRIGNVLEAFMPRYGGVKFAIGRVEISDRWDVGNRYEWHTIVSLPDVLNDLFTWEYTGFGCFTPTKQTIEIFKILGIKIPDGNFEVYFENAHSAGIQYGRCEMPSKIGWWSYDFSGYGSLIEEPFTREIDRDFIYKHIRQIGYLAQDANNQEERETADRIFAKKFLRERILPFFDGIGVEVADGAYRGRPLNMKRGSENHRNIYPKKIEDLETFAGLGTFLSRWI